MKNKLFNICLLLIIFSAPVFSLERVVDNAGLLTTGEIANLRSSIASISSKYNFDLVIVTERNIGGMNIESYADNFFENNGYGLGADRSGALFLQVTDTREIFVSTTGSGIRIVNNNALNKILNDAISGLRTNSYYRAYNSFLVNMEEFLVLYSKGGRTYNIFYKWNFIFVAIGWLIAAAIGFITVASWKSKMNTAITQTQAGGYMIPNSLSFKVKQDSFLYSTVTKTPRPKQQGGGSSLSGNIRTSSSGRSFGGGGRKY